MMFIVFLILIVIGMIVKKFKWYNIFAIAFITIITYLGNDIQDFENYQMAYNSISRGNFYMDLGFGWFSLCKIGTIFSLNYLQFKTIIMILTLLLVNYSVNYFLKDSKYKNIVWAFYLIFPALLDCIQIRFFLAEAIIIFALRFLFSDKKKDWIIYTGLVLLAGTIHSAVLFYLIFLLNKVFFKNEKKNVIIIIALSLALIIGKEYLIQICSLFINNERIHRYFYSADPLGIKGLIIHIAIVIAFYYISKKMKEKIEETKENKKDIEFFDNIIKMNLLISIIVAFSTFDPNFFRLQRIMWLLMYVGTAKLLSKDIEQIEIFKKGIPLKLSMGGIAIMGNLTFISITTPQIISKLLL